MSRQKRIIADTWPALKENGILIYCTCTYNENENEDNLRWLQREHDVEFLRLKIDPQWNIEEIQREEVTGYRFFPHRVKGEGFFMSVMKKKQPQHSIRLKTKKNLSAAPRKIVESVRLWIKDSDQYHFMQHLDSVSFLPDAKLNEVDILKQHLKIINTGTSVAAVKHEKIIPDHALAMSVQLQHGSFKTLALTRDEAIHFLRKDIVPLDAKDKGYHLITFENIALGWINHLGNRYNNMYPQEWRIRMDYK